MLHAFSLCLALWLVSPSTQDAIAQDAPKKDEASESPASLDHSAVRPVERGGWHRERNQALNKRVARGDVDLIFVGDSITQGWEGEGREVWNRFYGHRNAINLGISGDRTQHVLWRLDHGNLEGIDPRVAVVMIGTNNTHNQDNTVAEIADGVRAIVRLLRVKLPLTKVLLLDIFPRGYEPNPQRGKILQVNQLIQKLHDGRHVFYHRIGHHFVTERGQIPKTIMPDSLHLSRKGYEMWASAMEELLAELLGDQPQLPITHTFLAAGYGMDASIIGADDAVHWSYPARASDASILPNGNILLALYPNEEYPGGGMIEVSPEKDVVFSFKGTQNEVSTAVYLEDVDRYMMTELGPRPRLIEVTRTGEVAVEVLLQCQTENFHMQTRMARKLPSGNYLVPHLFDFAVKEYAPDGSVVKVFETDDRGREVHDWPFTAIRLENGNTLIGCTHGNRIIEVDAEGSIVWELLPDDLEGDVIHDACGVQRLSNGNTVFTSYAAGADRPKLIEVTRDKRVVWTYRNDNANGIHHFQILLTNGVPTERVPLR